MRSSKSSRYNLPKEEPSRLIDLAITQALEKPAIGETSGELRFSIAVAAFAQLLRGDPHLKSFGYDEVIALAAAARGDDPFRLPGRVYQPCAVGGDRAPQRPFICSDAARNECGPAS
jgi:hypothetical protein